ncbi:dephospho-CoA kinase [Jeongeupia naejangsanensis]|uniref:Dephospho-CoA kinase n=1 Tax=Jeongeupia naejangsanensis TaxID=613195 RepID=A0ABS2BQM3_9NEIS|nr:dephospho-CoA kinase [Jeongeupia naejangsanensis]MBM3117715.1 dephospho-CoA kinase [Jeongeupia naejangsanensis]
MHLIGLTGGIASGKSTVSTLFMQHGVPVIDTDVIAHRLSQPPSTALEIIREVFGPAAIDANGALARDWMRQHVFEHADARVRLEAILHPRILAELDQEIAVLPEPAPYALIAVPLLFEADGFQARVQRTLVVDCSEARQRQRLLNRPGMNEALADAIIASQLPRERRRAYADDVIENDGTIEALADAVARQHQRYLAWTSAGQS